MQYGELSEVNGFIVISLSSALALGIFHDVRSMKIRLLHLVRKISLPIPRNSLMKRIL